MNEKEEQEMWEELGVTAPGVPFHRPSDKQQRRVATVQIPIFKRKDLLNMEIGTNVRDNERDQNFQWRLKEKGPWRDYEINLNVLSELDALARSLPNFAQVIEEIRGYVALAQKTNRPLHIPPLLLLGPPGVGKSHFCRKLAGCLGVPHRWQAMDNAQGGEELAGSASFWSNSKTGLVFDTLAFGDHASPLILLDEIDKAPRAGSRIGGDTLAALHTLLEPETAQHFKDASFPLPLNASHIIWVATANSDIGLDQVLLSRFSVHDIEQPTLEQARDIGESMVYAKLNEFELENEIFPTEDFLDQLAYLTPRQQRQAIDRALGRAVLGKRQTLQVSDLEKRPEKKTVFGFLPQKEKAQKERRKEKNME